MDEIILKGVTEVKGMKFHDIEGGFGVGKKSMLVKDIAEIHDRELMHINEAINKNRKKFKDGIHILDVKGTDFVIGLVDNGVFTQNAVNRANNIYILSERGYAILLKILEDDVAWEQYEKLVDGYFNMRAEKKQRNATPKIESLYSVTLAVKQVSELYKAAGMNDVHLLMATKMLYRKADVDLPVSDLKAKRELFCAEDMAKMLGVFSSSSLPHKQAVGAILSKIVISDDEKELVHFEKNGYDDTHYCYSRNVVEKVHQWLQANQYPETIEGSRQKYKVVYKQDAV